jgi:hypothetical protein
MMAVEAVAMMMPVAMSDIYDDLGVGCGDHRGEEQDGEEGEHVSLHTIYDAQGCGGVVTAS